MAKIVLSKAHICVGICTNESTYYESSNGKIPLFCTAISLQHRLKPWLLGSKNKKAPVATTVPEGRDDKAAKSVTDEEEVFDHTLHHRASCSKFARPSMHVQVEASVYETFSFAKLNMPEERIESIPAALGWN